LLGKAGITLEGKRGPHTFRHARAVSLLRAAVPLKAIGDILGHTERSCVVTYGRSDCGVVVLSGAC
jgi:integrase